MKIVVAPDSFKESLSAKEVALAIARGIQRVLPDATVLCIPMADGGEGTVNAVLAATKGEQRISIAQDALGHPDHRLRVRRPMRPARRLPDRHTGDVL